MGNNAIYDAYSGMMGPLTIPNGTALTFGQTGTKSEVIVHLPWESLKQRLILEHGSHVLRPYGDSEFEEYFRDSPYMRQPYKHTFKAIAETLKLAPGVAVKEIKFTHADPNVIIKYE